MAMEILTGFPTIGAHTHNNIMKFLIEFSVLTPFVTSTGKHHRRTNKTIVEAKNEQRATDTVKEGNYFIKINSVQRMK